MIQLLLLSVLLSAACVGIAQFYAWPASLIDWLLAIIGLWCALQIIGSRIADLRSVMYSMEYQTVKRTDVTIPAEWRKEAYIEAALVALFVAIFGGLLGAAMGWWLGGQGLILKYSLQLGLCYGLPICLAIPYLVNRYMETRRFIIERKPLEERQS